MTIKIQKDSIKFDQLVDYLVSQFPKYRFWKIKKNTLKIAKSKFVAAYVTVYRNKIVIKGGFAKGSYYLLYAIFVLFFGIVVPLIFTYLVVYPRIQLFLQGIADEVYIFYRNNVLNYSQFGRGEEEMKNS